MANFNDLLNQAAMMPEADADAEWVPPVQVKQNNLTNTTSSTQQSVAAASGAKQQTLMTPV